MIATSSKRIPEFDGLRGVAAIVVVVSHIVAAFMPVLYFGPEGGAILSWQGSFAMSPFFVMVSGSFAVFVFFVLSGFVIAASADASRSSIAGNCVARVIRLGLPCSASLCASGQVLFINLARGRFLGRVRCFSFFISNEVLGSKVGQFLGRISFGVYLIHFTLLHSVMAYLFISVEQIGLVVLSLFVILYVVLVIASAFAFTLLVDEPATRLAGLVKGLVWTHPIERAHYAAPSKV